MYLCLNLTLHLFNSIALGVIVLFGIRNNVALRSLVTLFIGVPLLLALVVVTLVGSVVALIGFIWMCVFCVTNSHLQNDFQSVKKGCTWVSVVVTASWVLCIVICVAGVVVNVMSSYVTRGVYF